MKRGNIMSEYQTYYRKRQMQLREQAIEWQMQLFDGIDEPFFWVLAAERTDYFRYWGKRYGLLREFRENAII